MTRDFSWVRPDRDDLLAVTTSCFAALVISQVADRRHGVTSLQTKHQAPSRSLSGRPSAAWRFGRQARAPSPREAVIIELLTRRVQAAHRFSGKFTFSSKEATAPTSRTLGVRTDSLVCRLQHHKSAPPRSATSAITVSISVRPACHLTEFSAILGHTTLHRSRRSAAKPATPPCEPPSSQDPHHQQHVFYNRPVTAAAGRRRPAA